MYRAFFDRKRQFGVELEFYGIDQFELQYAFSQSGIKSKIELHERPVENYWTITSDMSLEEEDGLEIISPILCGVEGLLEVKKVLGLLDYLEVHTNEDCGLHVHWYAKDFTGKNLLALLRLYAKFEQVIDGLVALNRREDRNPHCRSLVCEETIGWINDLNKKQDDRAIEVALKFDHNYRVKNVGRLDALGSRHHKVNIVSYFKYGTTEFRHFQGTTDMDDVLNWIVFTQQFVNKAKHGSVSREMSARPILGEMIRILGMADYQEVSDPLVLQAREWVKSKYSNVRRKKKENTKEMQYVIG